LGEGSPQRAVARLREAAAPFGRSGAPPQIVLELIVTVADAVPGRSGDYSHDVPKREVARYLRVAERQGALVVLDLQPGRADFLTVARRWAWALRKPHVGLALDPEWRMGPHQVPGRVIGSVGAAEVNEVSAWLERLIKRNDLPQKVLVLHQFRIDMIRGIERIAQRRGVAMVQHVDGFGTPGQKLDTFSAVLKPKQFFPGWKLFYDEDRPLMRASGVKRIRPKVRFVSFQ
jgi:hypothetical protein